MFVRGKLREARAERIYARTPRRTMPPLPRPSQQQSDERESALLPLESRLVPIHLRAEPGDYADACLLPGDPLRAKYIAETYFDDVGRR